MEKFGRAGVDSPRRDALVLLEDALGKDRAWVLAHPEHELNVRGPSSHKLQENIQRRIAREPLAYIRGKAWFYGRFFAVTPDVMIPRPESEAFITLLQDVVRGRTSHIVDVGTGSGCLAITAKLELPEVAVTAVDISPNALSLAKNNANDHKVSINFVQSDLLDKVILSHNQTDSVIIMANLPYVPEGLVTSPEITHEPSSALFSGKDGLNHYRRFWDQIASLPSKPTYILTESLSSQHESLRALAKNTGYKQQKAEQLTQLFCISLENPTSHIRVVSKT